MTDIFGTIYEMEEAGTIQTGDYKPLENDNEYIRYLNYLVSIDNNIEGRLQDGFNCTKCKDRGYITIIRQPQATDLCQKPTTAIRKCECMPKRIMVRSLHDSQLNVEKYALENYKHAEEWQTRIYENARSFIENPRQSWFFIGGQSGAGKTYICSAICIELVKNQHRQVHYMLWREEATEIKSLVNDAEAYKEKIDRIKRADVLYIDDLFKVQKGASPTPADINLCFEILDYRYRKNLITVISSEFTLKQLLTIDEAVGGRIAECSKLHRFSITKDENKNIRLKGGKK